MNRKPNGEMPTKADVMELAETQEQTRNQSGRLAELLRAILPRNRFWAERLGHLSPTCEPEALLQSLPFTTKDDLQTDQAANPPLGSNLTFDPSEYLRFHQTSGTRGTPIRWLDTSASWQWMLGCWKQMYAMAGVTSRDRLFFAFSFGPFLGFWTGFEAAGQMGCLCIPGGGMSSAARLRLLIEQQASVLCCTPTYALHLAQTAVEKGIDLQHAATVRKIIVAGEPGGSIPATRELIESAWGARVFDHSGMTEVGPMAIECEENPLGMHVLETEYVVEVIDPKTLKACEPGELGELVVTNLGRLGSPLIRYRTGDLVCVDPDPCPCGRPLVRLKGGILGRTDDMIPIRGNNFYPSALEGVLRRIPEILEYRVEVDASAPLAELKVEIEADGKSLGDLSSRVANIIRDELLFRAEVKTVPLGTLPRFEMKAQRIHIKKGNPPPPTP